MQIKKLESDIGQSLTEKVGKKISLTAAGVALRSTIKDIFESLSRFEMEIDDQLNEIAGYMESIVMSRQREAENLRKIQ